MYLASLEPNAELSARRLAERSRIPDDDPMWLMLHEMQQSVRELTRGANAALTNEPFALRLASAVASRVANDERIIDAVAAGVDAVRESSVRTIRLLESEIHELACKRAIAPLSSLAFAFALALVVGFAAIWASYNVGTRFGSDLGYREGFHDRLMHERSRR
jgi:hypothetical protein